jgi:Cu(I)/Ag(I) efflux system membrane fusion protein
MLKKLGIYMVFVLAGILLGYLFFESSSNTQNPSIEMENVGKWTCSMHPQIDGEENGTCPLCSMDLVFVDDTDTGNSQAQFKMTDDAIALANVQTIKVGYAENDTSTIQLSGIITTNQETDAVQTTLFDGRIDELYANYVGKKIRKGQEIGLIYSPELYLAQDKLLTSASYRGTHEKLYNAARNTLGLWKMTDEQVETMLVSGKPMVNFPIYADVTGTVMEIIGLEGNYYSQGSPLFKTSDLRTVWAVFDAYESQLKMLKVGQDVEIKLVGVKGETIKTKISFIEPILDKKRRTVSVRAVLNNVKGKLKPGMFAEAAVNTVFSESPNSMVTIPKSAVLWTGKRSLVYKKPFADKPVFEMTEIELGQNLGEKYEILSGLNYGDIVVTEGAFTIDAAAQLSGKKSMMFNAKSSDDTHGHDDMNMEIKDKKNKDIPIKIDISLDFEKNFEVLLQGYLDVKNALVSSDYTKAQKKSQGLTAILNKNEVLSSTNIVHVDHIKTRLKNIGALTDIEKQRKEFKYMSKSMLTIANSIGNFDSTLYILHCDCADGFKGGSWLSYEKKVLNPYFGDAMLTCGRVEQVLN